MAFRADLTRNWNGSPAASPPYFVELSLSSSTGDMIISIDAPFFNDNPPPVAPCRYDELSDFEVVEIFISGMPNPHDPSFNPYIEIEVGPHGHYFIIFFLNEADWDTQDNTIMLDNPPIPIINRDTGRWTSNVHIPSYLLPEPLCGDDLSCTWMVNTFAIHGSEPQRDYLAYAAVPGKEPNFHQLGSFVKMSLFETVEIRRNVDRSISVAKDLLRNNKDVKTVGFTYSKDQPSSAVRLLEDIMENVYEDEEEVLSFAAAASANDYSAAISSKGPAQITVAQVAQRLREEQLKSPSSSAKLALDDKFLMHVQADEFVVLHGMLWKRKGLSFKKRMLLLTSKPRLLYFDGKGVYKGSIPWLLTKPLRVIKVSSNICVCVN
jgi:hypothetical protein